MLSMQDINQVLMANNRNGQIISSSGVMVRTRKLSPGGPGVHSIDLGTINIYRPMYDVVRSIFRYLAANQHRQIITQALPKIYTATSKNLQSQVMTRAVVWQSQQFHRFEPNDNQTGPSTLSRECARSMKPLKKDVIFFKSKILPSRQSPVKGRRNTTMEDKTGFKIKQLWISSNGHHCPAPILILWSHMHRVPGPKQI